MIVRKMDIYHHNNIRYSYVARIYVSTRNLILHLARYAPETSHTPPTRWYIVLLFSAVHQLLLLVGPEPAAEHRLCQVHGC